MKESSINNANKMLFYRTVLCFSDCKEEKCTVTGIAKKLNVEKYQISRIITSLEQQGIVEKDSKGVPSLTEIGINYISDYHKRVDLLVSFLLRSGLDPSYARDISLHIAGHANDAIMEVIEDKELRMQVKDTLAKQDKFSGTTFVKKMNAGSYTLPFVIITKQNSLLTFFGQDKENTTVLNIVGKKGNFQIHPGNKVRSIEFFDNGEYISAENVGEIFFIPADVVSFVQMGHTSQFGRSFCGMVNIKISFVEGDEKKQAEGVFEIIF